MSSEEGLFEDEQRDVARALAIIDAQAAALAKVKKYRDEVHYMWRKDLGTHIGVLQVVDKLDQALGNETYGDAPPDEPEPECPFHGAGNEGRCSNCEES
jgi:hypothetical protein